MEASWCLLDEDLTEKLIRRAVFVYPISALAWLSQLTSLWVRHGTACNDIKICGKEAKEQVA